MAPRPRMGTQHPSAREKLLAGWWLCLGKMKGLCSRDPTCSLHASREGVSELTSVCVVGVPLQRLRNRLRGHTRPPTLRGTDLPLRGPMGEEPAPRGGVQVADARGHAPHLGTDPEAVAAPLGEDGALGAEGGGGGK